MIRFAIYFSFFSTILLSQQGRYSDYNAVDGPGSKAFSKIKQNNLLPSRLFKYKDPSISGGKISDVTKRWPLQNNVDATSAPFMGPLDMAEDANGNLYISSPDLHVIRKVDTNGKITTFAGTGGQAWDGDGDLATKALFNGPHGLAFDASGNLYVADRNNHVVRKIDTNGIITTVAGKGGDSGFSGDGGAATSAQIREPYDVVFDAAGNMYISTYRRIRKVDTSGIISTIAGDGGESYRGEGGLATSATIANPANMVFDKSGKLYFADFGHHVVNVIDTDGKIYTVYGVGDASGSSDNDPKRLNTPFGVAYHNWKVDARNEDEELLYIMDYQNHVIIQLQLPSGGSTNAQRYIEADILWGSEGDAGFDGDGDSNWDETARFNQIENMITSFSADAVGLKAVYHISDYANHRVRKIVEEETFANNTDASSMSTVAGADIYNGTNIAANTARLYVPRNSAFDKNGNYFVADQGLHIIRKIDTNGIITTVAGTPGVSGFSGDGGAATSAKLNNPRGVTVDSQGNLYISDSQNHRIRKVDTNGAISTLAGDGSEAHAGDGGASTSAKINFPYQITVDPSDNVYFADYSNQRIRKIDTNGTITTVAGNGTRGYEGDGNQATSAQINNPLGVTVDASGNLYIADTGNHVIRKVDTSGNISTLAGSLDGYGYNDGSGGGAKFSNPSTLATDSKGNVYVTDSSNNRVRKITPGGTVSTVVGNGNRGYENSENFAALTSGIASPYGIAIDANDNIYVSDSWNYLVRKITPRNTTLKVPSEYSTIQKAVEYAIAGDTILIAPGTYPGDIVLDGTDGKSIQFTIMGENKLTTIIDGASKPNASVFYIKNAQSGWMGPTLSNLTIKNGSGTSDPTQAGNANAERLGGGIFTYKADNITLSDLIIENNTANSGGGFMFFDGWGLTVNNLIVRNNSGSNGSAMQIKGNEVYMSNLLVVDNGAANDDNVINFQSGGKIHIENMTVANNIGYAMFTPYHGPELVIYNSIIDYPSIGGLPPKFKPQWEDASYKFYASNVKGGISMDKNFTKDPDYTLTFASEWIFDEKIAFKDSANGDYSLNDWSPLIGKGVAQLMDGRFFGQVANDIIGNPRPNPSGSDQDLGAYENKYASSQNAPPVLSVLPDVSVNEDETITFTVEAINADTLDNDAITFTATSDKDAVKVNMGSTSGKLDISANSNWNGVSKISVSATDGKAFDYGNFTVNFIPVNDKPELQAINDYSTDEEVAKSIMVNATDIDGDQLTISATTDSDQVVPTVNGMELTLTPKKDYVGSSKVSVIVNDGALTDTVQYVFTVLNVNDAPVLSEVKDQIISEDTHIKIKVFATDIDDSSIAFSGNSENAGVLVTAFTDSIKLQPEADWFGSSVITVYASDGKDVDSVKFTLKVNPMQDSPYDFEWLSAESDSVVVSQQNLANTYNLEWSESIDVDKEGIDYLVYAKIGVYEKELIYDTTATELPITYLEIVENVFEGIPGNGATVTFSVSATDRIDTVHVKGSDRVLYVNRYDYLSTQFNGIPEEFVLHDNYPNPFNPTTQIRFDLPYNGDVQLIIYNMLGQKVKQYSMNNISAGYHSVMWNATNDLGDPVSAGVYLYQLHTKGAVLTNKMILLK